MSRSTEEINDWMKMFRWIVKLIRDEFAVEEKLLTRSANLEKDCQLSVEQIEQILDFIAEEFSVHFPDDATTEVVRLDDLCMLTSWIKGFYKRPDFVTAEFEARCRQLNAIEA
ncbi:MAG: acyl carrier protein [Azospirillum sp.]|nr:acyl carrier protein [Azospirillum sp.]